MRSLAAWVVLFLLVLAGGPGCGGGASTGSVTVEVDDTGSPNPPQISVPSATRTFRLEIIDPNGGERQTLPKDEAYGGSGSLEVEIPDVPQGEWVARLSALNAAGRVLAYYQTPVEVNSGSKIRLQAELETGPAPEGLLFVANSSGSSLSVVNLLNNDVNNLPLTRSPQYLFTQNGMVYATTGGPEILVVEGISLSYQVIPSPSGNLRCRGGTTGVVSFPNEGGVRFIDTNSNTFSSFLPSGAGALGLSRQVGDSMWVANPGDGTMTQLNVPNQVLGPNILLGAPGEILDQNDNGSRVYVIGGLSVDSPFIRVYEPEGALVQTFTDRLQTPSDVLLLTSYAYVVDSSRGELIKILDSTLPAEENRLNLGEGSPTNLLTDGTRLYITMESSGEVTVVDTYTFAIDERIKVGQTPRGMALLR